MDDMSGAILARESGSQIATALACKKLPPSSLPSDFSQIADYSPKGDVLVLVPGTPKASEALAVASTADVERVHR